MEPVRIGYALLSRIAMRFCLRVATLVTLLLATLPAVSTAQSARAPSGTSNSAAARSTHVIVVITDGFRWQELFGGADSTLMGKAGKVSDSTALHREFWRATPDARRSVLLPFVWGTMASQGQILGDSTVGSRAVVTNGLKFSFPGYSEAFTGFPDRRIDSNEHGNNENRTVFEWLNTQSTLKGKVAAFATWHAFRRIINSTRSGIPVFDGWDNAVAPTGTARAAVLRDMLATQTRMWPTNTVDAITHYSMLDYTALKKPRVLFIGYGETDEWAHDGRYELYLRSAHQVDKYLAELWANAQANPVTRNKTTLIVTTDHGRGRGAAWTDHGEKVDGAERVWMAVLGPDVPALGVRRDTPTTQSQVAATIAAALGLDWPNAEPKAAKPLPVFGR